MRVNKKFKDRELRCYKLDNLFYYDLQKDYIETFYQDERIDDFSLSILTGILTLLNDTNVYTSTQELAVKIRFIDTIKEITPKIYKVFATDNQYSKYNFEMVRATNKYLLNWRLQEADLLNRDESLTDKQIYKIAIEGFEYEI